MIKQNLNNFINKNITEIFTLLDSNDNGLSTKDAGNRLKDYGHNILVEKYKRPIFIDAIFHSINPLVGILLIAAAIAAFTGSKFNTGIIILIVLLSILLDYIQSHRSLSAARRLQAKVALTATVIRDHESKEIQLNLIVPGDVIHLTAGDMVPADVLLISTKDLHVQQSALTGESLPIEKLGFNNHIQSTLLTDSPYLAFAGTSIISGSATAIVLITGKYTTLGKIAESLTKPTSRTEFEKGIARFGFFIMKTVFFLVMFVFVVTAVFKYDPIESLLFAVALAVGLTPEFLPMIVTVTLAKSAIKMSKMGVIVKNLASIQNFGSIDIFCSDKTGTLTEGTVKLEQHIDINGQQSEYVLLLGYLNSLFETEVNSDLKNAIINKTNINPLDAAILKSDHPSVQPYHKIDEIPFNFEHRYSSVIVEKNEERLLITKGAPENILNICRWYRLGDNEYDLNSKIQSQCIELFRSLSAQGYRCLAIAYKNTPANLSCPTDSGTELVFAGYLVFFDPPVEDASEIVKKLQEENVKLKILTGDNDLVARFVAKKIGFDSGTIMLGDEIDKISDEKLSFIAEKTQIFARVTPAQKLRIIHALRQHGHVVGYLGDGINDAPSLQASDIGISVVNAVDIAKEAAAIILLKRNLKLILEGIIEGRKAFGNIMKYLMMGTSSNFGNMFSMAGAVLLLPFLPMLPSQILLNNLLYDFAQITIPTDNVDPIFIKKPRRWDINIIRQFMFYIGPISSIFDFLTFFVMLKIFQASAPLFQTGWFVESLATQTLVIFIIRTAKNPFTNLPSLALSVSVLMAIGIGILLPYSPFAHFFNFVPLPNFFFGFLFIATVLYLILVEIIKRRLMWSWLEKMN